MASQSLVAASTAIVANANAAALVAAGVASARSAIDAATGGSLLMVSPQNTIGYQPIATPPGFVGPPLPNPPPLLFHYEGEQGAQLDSEITDHYIEDNTAIQDQIAQKPVIITTHGFIGELNNVPPTALAAAQSTVNALQAISAYQPALSSAAQLAYNEALSLYQTAQSAAASALSAITSLSGTGGESVIGSGSLINGLRQAPNQNLQQSYFQAFYFYWLNKVLFQVQTPWAVFQNMAIMSLKAVQDETTQTITDFQVTFKQLRFAQLGLSATNVVTIPTGQLTAQSSPVVNLGSQALSVFAGFTV